MKIEYRRVRREACCHAMAHTQMKDEADRTRQVAVEIMGCRLFSVGILKVEPAQLSDKLDMEHDRK